jgi:MHS family proline/betaine transporter-like MFS transporter
MKDPAVPPALPAQQRPAILVLAASAGNALEFYDFTVFGYFAPQIGAAFFPASTTATTTLYAWGTFFTAFLARPIGAVVLGSFADRHGRKASMTLSILLMTFGTLALAITPGFARIGLAAPLSILAARVLQGFSTGGEFGGATAFMLEHGRGRRGLMASFQFTSQAVSSAAGAGVAYATSLLMPAQALHDWGFRLPFMVGLLIAPVGFYLRSHAAETPVFTRSGPTKAPAMRALREHPGRILLAAGTIAAGTAGTYIAIYLPSYAQQQLHMSAPASFAVPLIGALLGIVITPASATLSDRVGRLWPALAGSVALLALAYPAFLLIDAVPRFGMLLVVMVTLIGLRSAYSAPLPALLGEIFPPAVRGVGMSVGYSLGVTLFGGLTPVLCTFLIDHTHDRTMPGIYLALCSLLTVGCLVAIKRSVPLQRE